MSGRTRMIRRGTGHSYELDGEPVPGVTTILRDGWPKPALKAWAGKMTAAYAVDHWDDLAEKTPTERFEELRGAQYETTNALAGRGTAIHALAEQLLRGNEVDVPEELTGHVDACLAFLDDWKVAELAVEAVVVNRGNGAGAGRYMGCLDLLAVPHPNVCDDVWLFDWKTGTSGIYPETSLQLAAYAHAQTILLGDDGQEVALPKVEHAAAVWLRADGYDVYEVNIAEDVYRAFLYVQQVAAFYNRPRVELVGESRRSPVEVAS